MSIDMNAEGYKAKVDPRFVKLSNQQILEKAISKAIDGGWTPTMQINRLEVGLKQPWKTHDYMTSTGWWYTVNDLIFNHSFCKALWGEENFMRYDGDTLDPLKMWQYHLQQMVISEDPIKYLGENP